MSWDINRKKHGIITTGIDERRDSREKRSIMQRQSITVEMKPFHRRDLCFLIFENKHVNGIITQGTGILDDADKGGGMNRRHGWAQPTT